MLRPDRLIEARDVLLKNYLGFWGGDQQIPTEKVSMDLLLVDLINQLLHFPDEKGDTLINRNSFVRTDESRRASTATQAPVLAGNLHRGDEERNAESEVREANITLEST